MAARPTLIVGTAGHIDHGKTSLVRALTGTDTDRLAEEKRRGISIDLGFAHTMLDDGTSISFVDVPGHERFVRNMLAGAGGINAVILVVATDESVKPQTREHFEICRFLGVERGIVALTKRDLATTDRLRETTEAVRNLVHGSFLEGAPVIAVSSTTGEGINDLRRALREISSAVKARCTTRVLRLPVDRSITLKGFGTVVTGTLWSGTLRAGDTVQMSPSGEQARIRGLRVHDRDLPTVEAGRRVAVNLSGVDASEISRGFTLAAPESIRTTAKFDVALDWLEGYELPGPREDLLFHLGTAEITAHVKLLSPRTLKTLLARISLQEQTVAFPGDRFVLRRPSPAGTVSGGVIVDPFPPLRSKLAKTRERVLRLLTADLPKRLEILVGEDVNGKSLAELTAATGQTVDDVIAALREHRELLLIETAHWVVTRAWLTAQREDLLQWLRAFHEKNPALKGAPVAQTRLGLEPALAAFVVSGFSAVRVSGDLIWLAEHEAQISPAQAALLAHLEQAFRVAGYQPPPASEVMKAAGLSAAHSRSSLEFLIKGRKLVRVAEDLVFHADVIAHIRQSLAAQKGRRFSVPEFKQWTQTSRKHAIPLLEYLDFQKVTRREGDNRVIL